jgi:hypothetical protein
MEKSVQKNAAVSVNVKDWGFDKNRGGWIELEFNGSFQDENGQVIFKEPSVKRVNFPINPTHTTGVHPLNILSDQRRRGPI